MICLFSLFVIGDFGVLLQQGSGGCGIARHFSSVSNSILASRNGSSEKYSRQSMTCLGLSWGYATRAGSSNTDIDFQAKIGNQRVGWCRPSSESFCCIVGHWRIWRGAGERQGSLQFVCVGVKVSEQKRKRQSSSSLQGQDGCLEICRMECLGDRRLSTNLSTAYSL